MLIEAFAARSKSLFRVLMGGTFYHPVGKIKNIS